MCGQETNIYFQVASSQTQISQIKTCCYTDMKLFVDNRKFPHTIFTLHHWYVSDSHHPWITLCRMKYLSRCFKTKLTFQKSLSSIIYKFSLMYVQGKRISQAWKCENNDISYSILIRHHLHSFLTEINTLWVSSTRTSGPGSTW